MQKYFPLKLKNKVVYISTVGDFDWYYNSNEQYYTLLIYHSTPSYIVSNKLNSERP